MRLNLYRMRRRITLVVAAAVLAALILADQSGWLLVRHSDDIAAYHGMKTRATRVIDGDTLEINIPDSLNRRSATRVRLLGVNCPELAGALAAAPRTKSGQALSAQAEPWAQEAANWSRSVVQDADLTIWLEPRQTRDAYGSVLARIELPDGRVLNEVMLQQGLARVDDRVPHADLTRYAQIEFSAKRRQVGLWAQTAGAN